MSTLPLIFTFFNPFLLLTINHVNGTTPPKVKTEPPIIRNHVSVWKAEPSTNELLRAYHKPLSVTVLNWRIPAGKRSRNTISSKPILIDQKAVLINRGFHAEDRNSSWQQKSMAASARLPYTPIKAAC